MKRLIYRSYNIHERDDDKWNIHKPEGNVLATVDSEEKAYNWVEEKEKEEQYENLRI